MPLFSRFNSCNLNPDSTAPRKLGEMRREPTGSRVAMRRSSRLGLGVRKPVNSIPASYFTLKWWNMIDSWFGQ